MTEVGGAVAGVRVLESEDDAAWRRVEERLLAADRPLPLYHRSAWVREVKSSPGVWIVGEGERGGVGARVEVNSLRSLPGHTSFRVRRFCADCDPDVAEGVLDELVDLAHRTPGVLKVSLEIFSRDPEARERLSALAGERGFGPDPEGHSYTHTLAVDLLPDEQEVFAGLGSRGRRGVRAVYKNPTEVRTVTDPALAPRLRELREETYERSGGTYEELPWAKIVRFTAAHPDLSRVSALFRTDRAGPEALLGYAWGCHHADSVEYAVGASTRPEDLSMGIMYGPLWDLMKWAKRSGATWFDLGGAPAPDKETDGAIARITGFKRNFDPVLIEVGEPLLYRVRPRRASVARFVSSVANRLR